MQCICTRCGVHMHWMWGAYALGVGCIIMHSLWVAYAPALGCICTPLGGLCARSETQTLMLAPALMETNCVQHHPMTQLCSSELDLPFVFMIVVKACLLRSPTGAYALPRQCICTHLGCIIYALELGCICTGVGVHMHSVWGAYAPAVGCTWGCHDKFSY